MMERPLASLGCLALLHSTAGSLFTGYLSKAVNKGLEMVEGKDVVKEEDNVISSLLSSSLFFPSIIPLSSAATRHLVKKDSGLSTEGTRKFSRPKATWAPPPDQSI
jgi:hypothetical protein